MSGLVQESLYTVVNNALQPEVLLVENESHMHSVPKNAETHFKITVVSQGFVGLSRVARHQHVYGVVQQQLQAGVHALALHLFTPEEWHCKGYAVPASPQCMGGAKPKDTRADEVGTRSGEEVR